MEDTIEQSPSWILNQRYFSYEDKNYEVLKMVKSKDPSNGVWYNAVEYKALYSNDFWPGSFIREFADFVKKFKPVKR